MKKSALAILLSVMFASCKQKNVPVQDSAIKEIDTTYLRTGFYYLADGDDGIVKQCEYSKEIYTLSKTPFASVDDVVRTELKWEKLEDKTYPNLCLYFNEKGKQDLAEGTGNPLHPRIAAVVAGKLLYVVSNSAASKVTNGVVCMYVIVPGVGISTLELEAMKKAVDEKR